MKLKYKRIDRDFEDMDQLIKLNKEAFPNEERENIKTFMKFSNRGVCDFLAYYYRKKFIGFTYTALNEDTAFICFLAVNNTFRSKGFGSEILNIQKELYEGKQIVLDVERTDEKESDNIKERRKRKKFYKKNGFKNTGYLIEYDDISLELLHYGKRFNKKSFASLAELVRSQTVDSSLASKN